MKKCNSCGADLPDDSVFCQYCGSKDVIEKVLVQEQLVAEVAEDNLKQPTEQKGNNKALIGITICLALLACFLGYELSRYYRISNDLDEQTVQLSRDLSNTKAQLKTYKDEASNYEKILSAASSSSNTNFFASNTVLKNPNKTRIVFYIDYNGYYNISWEYSSDIILTTGNTSGGLVYLDVTYKGNGVGTIVCTNSVNNQKITIYCIGGN